MGPHLYLGLPGLATDTQTVHERLQFKLNLCELKESHHIHPKTFGSIVSKMVFEKRYGTVYGNGPVSLNINIYPLHEWLHSLCLRNM
jgi:20S proteasome subunit beta 3